jgi:hypothetical protein
VVDRVQWLIEEIDGGDGKLQRISIVSTTSSLSSPAYSDDQERQSAERAEIGVAGTNPATTCST